MGLADYTAAVLASSPKVYYKMDEASGNPQDSSGNGLHITSVNGSPVYHQPGPMSSYAILVPGGANMLRAVPTNLQNNITLELWFFLQFPGGNSKGVVYNGNSGADGFGLLCNTNGKLQGLLGGVAFLSETAATFTSGFSHVVMVRDAGTWKYYVNGNVDTANAGTNNPGPATGNLSINLSDNSQGWYAHIAIYETALSAADVTAHYAASQDPAVQAVQVLSMQSHIVGRGFT